MTAPTTPDKGLIGPLMKAYAHAFYIHFADAYGAPAADETVVAELWAGVDHLNAISDQVDMLTPAAATAREETLARLRNAANNTDKKAGVKEAIKALASFGMVMDRELLGLTDAALDPAGA